MSDTSAPEYLESGHGASLPPSRPTGAGGRGRKGLLVGGGVVAVLALAGGAVWAAMSILGTGPQPAQALPSTTLAYASIDLDPSGGQKIEAVRTLRKFPAFKDKIGLNTTDDIREKLFGAVQGDGACPDLSFKNDIDPWLGDRAAIAAVDLGHKHPDAVAAIQVKDDQAAESGLKKLVACAEKDTPGQGGGFVVKGDWAIVAQTQDIAQQASDAAAKSSLADDATFKKWTTAAGDSGIVTLYAAPAAGDYVADHADDLFGFASLFGLGASSEESCSSDSSGTSYCGSGGVPVPVPSLPTLTAPPVTAPSLPTAVPTVVPSAVQVPVPPVSSIVPLPVPAVPTVVPGAYMPLSSLKSAGTNQLLPQGLTDALRDFKGAAIVFRFHDGAFELEGAGDAKGALTGSGEVTSDQGSDVIETLPSDTAAAVGAGFAKGWFTSYLATISKLGDGATTDEVTKQLTEATGLQPSEIETLLGSSAAIAVGGDIDPDALSDDSGDFSDVPVALKVKGDPDQIKAVLDKLSAKFGDDAVKVVGSDADGDLIAIGPDQAFRTQVLADGKLGDDKTYRSVIGHRDGASSVLYVDLDRFESAIEKAAGDDKELIDNIKPLAGVGMSTWQDGDTAHFLLRVRTD